MSVLTVRNVPEEVHRALRVRAAEHGRSTEAEVREILAAAVIPAKRVKMGDALGSLGRSIAMTDDEAQSLTVVRDRTPAMPPELP